MVCVTQHGPYYDHGMSRSMSGRPMYRSPGYNSPGIKPESPQHDQGVGVSFKNNEINSASQEDAEARRVEDALARLRTRTRPLKPTNLVDLGQTDPEREMSARARLVSQEALRRPPLEAEVADSNEGYARKRRRSVLRPWDPTNANTSGDLNASNTYPTRPRAGSFPMMPASMPRFESTTYLPNPSTTEPSFPPLFSVPRRVQGLHIDTACNPTDSSPLATGTLLYPSTMTSPSLTPSPITPSSVTNAYHLISTPSTSFASRSPFNSRPSPLSPTKPNHFDASAGIIAPLPPGMSAPPSPTSNLRERRGISLSISFPNSAMARFRTQTPSSAPPTTLPSGPELTSGRRPGPDSFYPHLDASAFAMHRPRAETVGGPSEFRSRAEMHGLPRSAWTPDACAEQMAQMHTIPRETESMTRGQPGSGSTTPNHFASSSTGPYRPQPSQLGSTGLRSAGGHIRFPRPTGSATGTPHRPTLKPFPVNASLAPSLVPSEESTPLLKFQFQTGHNSSQVLYDYNQAPPAPMRTRARAQTTSGVVPLVGTGGTAYGVASSLRDDADLAYNAPRRPDSWGAGPGKWVELGLDLDPGDGGGVASLSGVAGLGNSGSSSGVHPLDLAQIRGGMSSSLYPQPTLRHPGPWETYPNLLDGGGDVAHVALGAGPSWLSGPSSQFDSMGASVDSFPTELDSLGQGSGLGYPMDVDAEGEDEATRFFNAYINT
ncbi:hypothetical protein BDV98DRAFT_114089 [Pterulicium gracile]|uniref:Uncharacterized protein n=1 Tax=Pterulicium gracile TaxID=1884261 RepID=A0A5C3QE83_9AGAR|nr:hypothetical protein BDV98DRAFT_114089 [Pterula gracilis]